MAKTQIRSAYGPRKRSGLSFEGVPSLTKQSMRDECDINTIVARFMKAGEWPSAPPAVYADLTGFGDLQASFDRAHEARDVFLGLPAQVREDFDNNPAEFFDFAALAAENAENMDYLREHGLVGRSDQVVTGSEASDPDPAASSGGEAVKDEIVEDDA